MIGKTAVVKKRIENMPAWIEQRVKLSPMSQGLVVVPTSIVLHLVIAELVCASSFSRYFPQWQAVVWPDGSLARMLVSERHVQRRVRGYQFNWAVVGEGVETAVIEKLEERLCISKLRPPTGYDWNKMKEKYVTSLASISQVPSCLIGKKQLMGKVEVRRN